MDQDLVSQGIELTLFGMGTVVVFLTLLVFVTSGMSAFVGRYFPTPPPPAVPVNRPGPDARVLAVISAAIHQHRHSPSGATQTRDQTP